MFNLVLSILIRIKNFIMKIFNIKTLGARALIVQNNQVLLVRHTYNAGWYTVGGGIDNKESPQEALIRELYEEVGITTKEPPTLFGVYYNDFRGRDDYVVLYIVKNFEIVDVKSQEIAEKKWFSLSNLPSDISPATKRRIEEYLGHRVQSDKW